MDGYRQSNFNSVVAAGRITAWYWLERRQIPQMWPFDDVEDRHGLLHLSSLTGIAVEE